MQASFLTPKYILLLASFAICTQVLSQDKPSITASDTLVAVNADCIAPARTINLEIFGNTSETCDTSLLYWQILVDLYGDWTYDYVYSFEHDELDDNFGTPENELFLAPTTDGQALTITLPEGIESSKYDHRAVMKVTDGCGIITSTTIYIQIVDVTAPIPYCVANTDVGVLPLSEEYIRLEARQFNLGSYDNCSNSSSLRYTFSSTMPDYDLTYNDSIRSAYLLLSCDELAGMDSIYVDVYVWDELDNYDYCTVQVDYLANCLVETCCLSISGKITSACGGNLNTLKVKVETFQAEFPITITASTEYKIEYLKDDYDYTITVTKDDDYLNGVSTLDLVLMEKHILGQVLFDSPYQYIAADINYDGAVTTLDYVLLEQLILGQVTELPKGQSWRMIDAKSIPTLEEPFTFSDTLVIEILGYDVYDADWIAIKLGDLNCSALTSGVVEEVEKGDLLLYPATQNPFTVETSFDFGQAEAGEVEVTIYTLTGSVVYQSRDWYGQGRHTVQLTHTMLSQAGTYFYAVSKAGQRRVQKVMKVAR
jgi:hypothetical protein